MLYALILLLIGFAAVYFATRRKRTASVRAEFDLVVERGGSPLCFSLAYPSSWQPGSTRNPQLAFVIRDPDSGAEVSVRQPRTLRGGEALDTLYYEAQKRGARGLSRVALKGAEAIQEEQETFRDGEPCEGLLLHVIKEGRVIEVSLSCPRAAYDRERGVLGAIAHSLSFREEA